MTDEEKVVEAGAEAPVDEAPPAEAGDEAALEEDAPRVAEQVEDPAAEVRFTRRTVWNIGTADGATEHVFEDGDERGAPAARSRWSSSAWARPSGRATPRSPSRLPARRRPAAAVAASRQ